MERLLTSKEVAEYLQVSVGTVNNWRQNDKGPRSTKAGRSVRYKESDVQAWIKSHNAGRDDL